MIYFFKHSRQLRAFSDALMLISLTRPTLKFRMSTPVISSSGRGSPDALRFSIKICKIGYFSKSSWVAIFSNYHTILFFSISTFTRIYFPLCIPSCWRIQRRSNSLIFLYMLLIIEGQSISGGISRLMLRLGKFMQTYFIFYTHMDLARSFRHG